MFENFAHKQELLTIVLSAAVPLRIMELIQDGGPDQHDYSWASSFAQTLGEKGDILMFRGAKKGQTASVFNDLAQALAIMSFVPGGVKVFGQRWNAADFKSKGTENVKADS